MTHLREEVVFGSKNIWE